jgi:hypothetical protein
MTEVTISTSFRVEALACSNSERALLCHLMFLWKLLARFGLFWGYYEVVEEVGVTLGYGVKNK